MTGVCALPEPEILDCFFDTTTEPHLLAMQLRWREAARESRQVWQLPNHSHLFGGLPQKFGIEVHRHSVDGYDVRLLWDHQRMHWPVLTRQELLNSDLGEVLAALRTDLSFLLDQPVGLPD